MPNPTPRTFSRRRFLRFGAAALLSGSALGAYTIEIEPNWLEIVRRNLPIAHLPPALEGKTLIQLSDLHVGRMVSDTFLFDTFEIVRAMDPDLLVLTGDFMTSKRDEQLEHTKRVLARVPHGRLATLGILGNHDYGQTYRYEDVGDALCKDLQNLGVDMLRNDKRIIGPGPSGLTIAGLDDFLGPNFAPGEVMKSLASDQANLVLCYNPDAADCNVWFGYQGWILAGHTHGGQCKPPFLDPPFLPVRNRRYTCGEFDLYDGRWMYINRALGNLMHVRFNVRPEITVFTLMRG